MHSSQAFLQFPWLVMNLCFDGKRRLAESSRGLEFSVEHDWLQRIRLTTTTFLISCISISCRLRKRAQSILKTNMCAKQNLQWAEKEPMGTHFTKLAFDDLPT